MKKQNKIWILSILCLVALFGSCKKTPGPAQIGGRWQGRDDSTKVVATLVVDTVYANGGYVGSLSLDSTRYPVLVNYNPSSCKGMLFYQNDRDSLGNMVLNDSSNLVGNIRGETDNSFRLEVLRHISDSTNQVVRLFGGVLTQTD
ncbi:MAG: hypothetical protein II144_00435 [Paludibacteraceae bacterium]|nr:hypothetical protein [Paludibacteraceae bacterium]MBQ2608206.1 hypothetical protein [Paludibacteraceae bacterium]